MATPVKVQFEVNRGAWIAAQAVLAGASTVALLSFGGQVVLAPLLVPLQWFAARHSGDKGRALFVVLAALLLVEVGLILGFLLDENFFAGVLGLALGAGAAVLFYRTTMPVDQPGD